VRDLFIDSARPEFVEGFLLRCQRIPLSLFEAIDDLFGFGEHRFDRQEDLGCRCRHSETPARHHRIDIKGAVAVVADRSELDFAGVTLTASERAADIRNGSRIYFSVSDVNSPTYSGNVHAIWTTVP